MFETMFLLADVAAAEPWTAPAVLAGVLLLVGSGAVVVGLLTRVSGRR